MRRLICFLLAFCFCFTTFTALAESNSKGDLNWTSIWGSWFYGQIGATGWPDGFVCMESETGSTYGFNQGFLTINKWDGLVFSIVRNEGEANRAINVFYFADGTLHRSHRFFVDGSMNWIDWMRITPVRYDRSPDGKLTMMKQSYGGFDDPVEIAPEELPELAYLLNQNATVTIDEKEAGRLHYGSYTIDVTDESGETTRLLDMKVSEDGSIVINWMGRIWTYDFPGNVYTPPAD